MADAGVPTGTVFATKPALAGQLIGRAIDAGVPAAWVTGDEVYVADPALRRDLQRRGIGYVLAVARSHPVHTGIGRRRAIDLAVRLPRSAWRRLSAGKGAHGERFYDWALVDVREPSTGSTGPASTGDAPNGHLLLIRRHQGTGELAFYRVWSPRPVPLAELVRVAGTRWNVEEDFQTGKELTGLDEHQVRRWTSWHRWTVLVMLAHAFLTVITATQKPAPANQADHHEAGEPLPVLPALIPLTRNEIRHLFVQLAQQAHHSIGSVLTWSIWRRHHQAIARTSHYRRRSNNH